MKHAITATCTMIWIWLAAPLAAQETVWVQVEAQPTLAQAQTRVRVYAGALDNVAGYYIGSGWYGIVLGPYTRPDAETLLARLRNSGRIPSDSFIATGSAFQQQFWPIGVAAETRPQPLPGSQDVTTDVLPPAAGGAEPPVADVPLPQIALPDETPREARASESLLTRGEREELQVALQWAGFYNSAIDGAFGRGTRAAMEAWQVANAHEPTGILTSAQRAQLLAAYNAVLDGLDLKLVRDAASGIEMRLPTGVVTFTRYDPPFVRFDATGEIDAQVLFISQPGDQNRLFGLYEILQTLEAFPPEGPRERRDGSFFIEGQDATRHSYVEATLSGGQIKGFALIWPAGDEARRSRLLAEMRASFLAIDGVLDPAIAPPDEAQAVDLVSGLAVRKPRLSRSGFFIGPEGTVLTTAEAVDGCERVTIDSDHAATIAHLDEDLGIAVLRPEDPLAPIGFAAFQTAVPRLQSDVAVAGYPYGGLLVTPSLTFGRLADLRGLNDEAHLKRLALTAQPGDAGGPVFDSGGAVLGMLLPRSARDGQVLPAEVSFSVDSDEILTVLGNVGFTARTTDTLGFMPPETLTLRAADQTVLVSCW